ncbi:SH3 domain-containing protein [Blautia sp. HCP3S3_H10_1]|uniref:SH3 domain-containing protein n=1 Tax=unclassified Blautia TaxID=2648079 RepID=UPI003F8E731F|nr:SH3 domain-containing protein [Clostridia bacterium]
MKRAGLAVLLLGAALCIPGCGFEEGAGASVTVIQATPTPIPTPTPEVTPTPEATPTPEVVVVQTASGVNVTKQDGTYVANADVNLRADASADAALIASVANGTQLTSTGVCDNGWVEISYEGQTAYVSGDYVSAVAADTAADGAAADGAAADGSVDQAAFTDGSADASAEAVAG